MQVKRWTIAHQLLMVLAFVAVLASVKGQRMHLVVPLLLAAGSAFAWLYPVMGLSRSASAGVFGLVGIVCLAVAGATIGQLSMADLLLLREKSSWLAGGLSLAYGVTAAAVLVLALRLVMPSQAQEVVDADEFHRADSEVFQAGIRYEIRILAMLGLVILLFLAALHFDLIPL